MNRGDVILVRFPHPSGLRGKKRPAVVVQSDAYAGAVSTLIGVNLALVDAGGSGGDGRRRSPRPRPRYAGARCSRPTCPTRRSCSASWPRGCYRYSGSSRQSRQNRDGGHGDVGPRFDSGPDVRVG